MSKAVLLSVSPKQCSDTLNGYVSILVRKTRPKMEVPFKCYLYCTKPNTTDPHEYLEIHMDDKIHKANGKVIAEFICSRILPIKVEYSDVDSAVADNEFPYTGMTDKEIMEYLGNGKYGYGWCVTDLIVYDKPKELNKLSKYWDYDDEDKRPCESCELYSFDYNENMMICGYDFDGENCPKMNLIRPPKSWCYVMEL